MNVPDKISTKKSLGLFLTVLLVVSLVFSVAYVTKATYFGAVTEVWVQPPFGESTYIIGQYNSTYCFAKNSSTGNYDYLSSSASTVFNNAINAVANGSAITIAVGTYSLLSSISINKSVSLIGEGLSVLPPEDPPADPDYTPLTNDGVILNIATPSIDGIIIGENVTGIRIQNIVINFTQALTGHGINADPSFNRNGLMYSEIKNVIVLEHDATHYGFRFVNFQHCMFNGLWSFGGLGFYFEDDSTMVDYGNSVGQELFARVKYNRVISNYIVVFNGKHNRVLALTSFQRLQIMDTSASNTQYCLWMNNTEFITFNEIDIEDPVSHKLISITESTHTSLYVTNLSGGNITHSGGGWNNYLGSGYLSCGGYYAYSDGVNDAFDQTLQLDFDGITGFTHLGELTHSFTIYTDGTFYYARNESTGQTYTSSSNASYVIQTAMNTLAVYGGKILFKQATYNLTTYLTPINNVILEGENWNTILRLNDSANTNIIRFTQNASNVAIRNLQLDGNQWMQSEPAWRDERSGIYSGNYSAYQVGSSTDNLRLENLYIHNIRCGAAIRLVQSNNVIISNVKIENCGNGIVDSCDAVFVGNSTYVQITNLEATNCTDTAIALCNTEGSTIVGIKGIGNGAGIAIGNEYGSTGSNHSIISNYNTVMGGFIANSTAAGFNVFKLALSANYSDHVSVYGLQLQNNEPNVYLNGLFVTLQGCHLGMKEPIVGKKDVEIYYGDVTIQGCTILDAGVGIETETSNIGALTIIGNTFGNVNTVYNEIYKPSSLIFKDNNGAVWPSDQIGSASFIVSVIGSTYYATNCTDGQVLTYNTNASATINNALGNLTSGRTWLETVLLKGNFSIDKPLLVRNFTHLVIDGSIYASANMEAMIECYDDAAFTQITVEGGILYGNKDFGVTCGGINFTTTSDSTFLTIKNVDVYYTEKTGVHLQKIVGVTVDDVGILYCDDMGFYFAVVCDSKITRIGTSYVALENVYMYYCQTDYCGEWYLGGTSNGEAQFFIVGCENNELANIRADNTYTHGVRLSQSSYNCFSTFHIAEPVNASKVAFWLQASFNNTATGFVIQKRGLTGTWGIGVGESDGSDMNRYADFVVNDCDVSVTGLGVNSQFSRSSIDGLLIENAGNQASCINGTAIAHGLAGAPTSLTVCLRGPTAYNSTIILCAPTVLSVNATHFVVELTAWETVGWTLVPITAVEAQTIYWIAVYKP